MKPSKADKQMILSMRMKSIVIGGAALLLSLSTYGLMTLYLWMK